MLLNEKKFAEHFKQIIKKLNKKNMLCILNVFGN